MMKITLILLLTVAIMQSATADELSIESFEGTGALTFSTITNGAKYRIEWASSPDGPWPCFPFFHFPPSKPCHNLSNMLSLSA